MLIIYNKVENAKYKHFFYLWTQTFGAHFTPIV